MAYPTPRTHTYNIRGRHSGEPIERPMKGKDRATRGSTAQIQRDMASKQTARRDDRPQTSAAIRIRWMARNAPRQASTGDETGGKKSERRTNSTTAIARPHAHRVAKRGERRDEPQASRASQHIQHDEMRTLSLTQPSRQSKQTER